MNFLSGLKQIEGTISLANDKVHNLKVKLEDLVFRAHRIAASIKNSTPHSDPMFGHDLQRYRREILSFRDELTGLSARLGAISTSAAPQEDALGCSQSVLRRATSLGQNLRSLHDSALLAHQHIRAANLKVEAWYLAQEIEEMHSLSHGLPSLANKILLAVTVPPSAGGMNRP